MVCVGSALLDIYLKSKDFKKISSGEFAGGVALCEAFGGKVEVEEMVLTTGGGGTNAAVSFVRKGSITGLIAELGTDVVAATIKEELVREGVDVSFLVEEKDEETGLSSVMVSSDGGRALAVYRGASKMLTSDDISWEQLDTEWFYVTSLGGRVELLERLIRFAKKQGIKLAVNPGMEEIKQLESGGTEQLSNLLKDVAVLVVNREEARALTGVDFAEESIWRSEQCLVGPEVSVITAGTQGGKVCAGGACYFYETKQTRVVDQTGAGDAFGTGLVAALMKDKDIETAIEWGKKQAASVVGFMGPKRGLLRLADLEI